MKKSTDKVTQYVAGFLMNRYYWEVALVRKRRPDWQAGKLNGIGGKIEPQETPAHAMRREFQEETGLDVQNWERFCILEGINVKKESFCVHFFRAFRTERLSGLVKKMTDEDITVESITGANETNSLPNVPWLIRMALYIDMDNAEEFHIKEVY